MPRIPLVSTGLRRRLLIGAVFVLLGVALLKKVLDYDLWYHLVIGREVVGSWHVPATEFYVYPMLGAPTGFHEYGFGVIFFVISSWFGDWGMSVFHAAIGATTLVLLWRAANLRGESLFVSLLLLPPLLWAIDYRMTYRAEAFLYLALAAEIYGLERSAAEAKLRWLLPVPALALLLTNIHPSVLVLLIVLAAYLPQALLDRARSRRDALRVAGGFGAAMVAGILASAVNPYGFAQLFLPLRFAGQNRLLRATAEFAPTLHTRHAPLLLVLCAVGVLSLGLQRRRRVVDALLLLVFAVLALRHSRNVPLLALLIYVPVARCLDDLVGRFAFSTTRMGRDSGRALALALLGLSTVLAVRSPDWGAGAVRSWFPVESATWIAARKPPGRIFNYPHLGGYLAWRLYDEYLVAVDGRHYYGWDRSLEIADTVFGAEDRYEEILREYDVTMIVTPGTIQFVGSLVPLVPILDDDEGWSLVMAEPAALLFLRSEVARSMGIETLSKDVIWRFVVADARGILETISSPTPSVYLSMGFALLKLGSLGDSEAWFSRYVRAAPTDRSAAQILLLLRQARQGDPDARRALDEMITRGRRGG